MRHLVSCSECHRQYKARPDKVGVRFRCRCGNVLTVVAPRGHDSRVIRCASCGAARSGGGRNCEHCGADFTLHERDLHTVCPECLTRVSDHACYCHHCGSLLSSEEEIGATTNLHCPSCRDEPLLHSRKLGTENVSALECDACAGLWLGIDVFQHLARQARDISLPPLFADREHPGNLPRPETPPQRTGYCPCPICGSFMHRRNYGYRAGEGGSGIIIEYCRSHGIWFGSGELSDLLDWIRHGGAIEQPGRPQIEPKRPEELVGPYPPVENAPVAFNAVNILDALFETNDSPWEVQNLLGLLFETRFR